MLHTIFIWLVVAGFAGAGLFNAICPAAQQESFVRWGYPHGGAGRPVYWN